MAGKPVPAFALPAALAGQAWPCLGRSRHRPVRAWSTSSPVGACRASPRRPCSSTLRKEGVDDRRNRHPRPARRHRRVPRPPRRPFRAPRRRPRQPGADGVRLVGRARKLRRRRARRDPLPSFRPDHIRGFAGDPPRVGAGAMRLLILLALALATPALADSSLPPSHWANRQLPDPRQEARARALMEELRCLVCQGQSIADSDADLAGDMRALVRERIAAGDDPARDPRLAGRALRRLGQLQAAGRATDLAAMGRADPAARRRRMDRSRKAQAMSGWISLAALGAVTLGALAPARPARRDAPACCRGLAVRRGRLRAPGPARPRRIPARIRRPTRPPLPLTGARRALMGQFNSCRPLDHHRRRLCLARRHAQRRRRARLGGARASDRRLPVGRLWQCLVRPCRHADPGGAAGLCPRDRARAEPPRAAFLPRPCAGPLGRPRGRAGAMETDPRQRARRRQLAPAHRRRDRRCSNQKR